MPSVGLVSRFDRTMPAIDNQRRPDLGSLAGLAETFPADQSLEIFRRICLTRYNDLRIREEQDKGNVKCLIYLSVGQESTPAAVSMTMKGSWVLGQHRCHGIYLSFDGNHRRLIDELLGLPTGANKGMGGSPPLQDFENGIIGHIGLIGDHVPVAVGVAQYPGIRKRVVCFFGDGAVEEDYVLAALGYAATTRSPILFVCEDNDLSILTPTKIRRTWSLVNIAEGFGMRGVDISDDPWLINYWTAELSSKLPAVLNVRTCRELWHVGTGCDGPPEWNRFELVKETLSDLGLANEAGKVEDQIICQVNELWDQRSRIPSVD